MLAKSIKRATSANIDMMLPDIHPATFIILPEEYIHKVFQALTQSMFRRVEWETTPADLPREEGEGTTFTIRLPIN